MVLIIEPWAAVMAVEVFFFLSAGCMAGGQGYMMW